MPVLAKFETIISSKITLSEEKSYSFNFNGKPCHILLTTSKGSRAFSCFDVGFDWLIRKDDSFIFYDIYPVKKSESGPIYGFPRTICLKNNAGKQRLVGWRDQGNFVILTIITEIEKIESVSDNEQLEQTKVYLHKIIEYFIDYYRWVFGDAEIRKFRINDCVYMNIAVSEKYDFSVGRVNAIFRDLKNEINLANNEFGHHKFKKIPDELAIQRFVDTVRLDSPLQLYQRLLLDAREQAVIFGEHDLSIILSESAFEVFLQKLLAEILTANKAKLVDGKQISLDDIEKGNVNRDLLKYARIWANFDFKETSEYENWDTNANKKRNDIVHRGKRGFVAQDAQQAHDAVLSFISVIERKFC